ncbi:MAG TPA: AAA family ATPase [Acidimicrobiales bacterium]|jgi:DNA-binding CsgD family transcriptional regulator|nr:AAA family ATPase [Acidimicrobiales bacterium]
MGTGDDRADSRSYALGRPLVEREAEISAIDDLLSSLPDGAGRVLCLEGGPGLGKSRLLAEAASRARDRRIRVLRCRAHEVEREYPFALALQLFEPALARCERAERDSLLADAAGLAAPLFGGRDLGGEPLVERSDFALVHGLYWLSLNIAHGGQLLICVDDLQWSDEASSRFLLYLAERLEGTPIGLLVANRPSGPGNADKWLAGFRRRPGMSRLSLCALNAGGVSAVVRFSFPSADDEFCAACAEVTGGNPFQVHEVLHEVAAHRISPDAGTSALLRDLGAATVGRAALFRLIRLGASARAVAEAVATLGDGAPLRRIAALADLDVETAARAIDALAIEGILEPGQSPAFVHPLIRELVAGDTPPARRAMAHRRAARVLAGEDVAPEQVAAQLLEAPGVGEAWAVDALRAAARRARAHGAPDAAIQYLRRALDEPPDQDSLEQVMAELGAAEMVVGAEGAVEHLRTAYDRQCDPLKRAETARLLARALAAKDQAGEAATVIEAAIAQVRDLDPDLAVTLIGDYLVSTALQPSLRQVSVTRVDPLLRSLPAASIAAQRRVNAGLALRLAQEPGPASDIVELADRAWDGGALLTEEGPDGPAWMMVVWALLLAEEYSRAERVTSAVIGAATEAGSVTAFAAGSYYRGFSRLRRGVLVEAQADAEAGMTAGGGGRSVYAAAAGILPCLILLERGDLQGAEAALTAASKRESRWMPAQAFRLHAAGRVAMGRQQPAKAIELFLQAGDWLETQLGAQHTVVPWRLDAARAALASGDPRRAQSLVEPLAELSDRVGLRIAAANAWGVLGLVSGGDEGITLLRRSAAQLSETPARLDHAYALAALGGALRRAGHRSDARPLLGEALDLARRLGASALAAGVHEELSAAGARPRREAVTGIASLTPSEQRVGRLAAQKRTNSQIAQALFVTPKTVEYHLRHVYEKLAITGRHQLEAALAEPTG